jgi:transposase
MTRYIGLDAHSESCTIVVLGQSGKRLRHERIQTSAELLKSFIKEVPRPRHLCMEEGTLSEWLYEELTPLVDKLVVVMPDRIPGNKSDLIDACKLADDLRRDAIRRPVYKAPGAYRALREAARTHYVLQRDKVRTKSRLNALCRGCGRAELGKSLYASKTRAEALQQLPEHLRRRAALFGQELDALIECSRQAEDNLREECGRVPIVKRLATAPGIGIVRAAYIVAVVMTPHRFRTARQFWSYSGLAVVTRSSSDWVSDGTGRWRRSKTQQTRGLNHNRHPLLKNVFKGAALQITLMPEHRLGQAYNRLLTTTKPNLARLTIARRLAAAVLAMWKNGEDYEPTKHEGKTM